MNENEELKSYKFLGEQAIEGVPLMSFKVEGYETFAPAAFPVEMKKVSDNESYAIFKGSSKAAKLTVKTSGSGNVRYNPIVTLEEVEYVPNTNE